MLTMKHNPEISGRIAPTAVRPAHWPPSAQPLRRCRPSH